jgi:large subunit ribosomal protein MRP49
MEIQLSLEEHIDFPPLAEHQPVEFACAAPPGVQLSLVLDGQPLEPFMRPSEATWRWRWNPGPAVGVHRAELAATWPGGNTERRTWSLRVTTRKIDQDRYQILIEDIQRVAYGILYTLAGASAEGAGLSREAPWQHSPIEEYYSLFEERFAAFERAARRIAARPREHLRATQERAPLGRAAVIGADALARLPRGQFDAAPPGVADELQEALRPGGGLLPREVPTDAATPTTDTYEHRLLKHLLTLLTRRARFVGRLAESEAARLRASESQFGAGGARAVRAAQIAEGCADAARRLRDLRGLPFLADVGPLATFRGPTPLLQRDPAYREVYRMWLSLRQPPLVAFDSPLFHLPIADMPQLYEVWCALEVVRALLALGGAVREQRLVTQPDAVDEAPALDFALDLAEDAPLLVIDHGERTLTLRYQPRYRPLRTKPALSAVEANQEPRTEHDIERDGSRFAVLGSARLGSLDRHTRVPDLVVEIRQPGVRPQALLLDAKYRIDADGRSVPQDALADAYTYLGAIGCSAARATIGALLLYPGAGAGELYPSGVGALPLLPGHPNELDTVLADLLNLRQS